jgi:hypothetical protein
MKGSGGPWPRGQIATGLLAAAGLALTLVVAALITKRLWPLVEPARSQPLLPPWPWQQPPIQPAAAAVPLQQLTPGWKAASLGNPAAWRYRSCWQSLPRTPWALALFEGQLYLGLGNASNEGPTANSGPVPLLSYSLSTGRWQQQASLPEEEISRFIAHGRELWIPGADARGGWRWGNLYRREAGSGLWWQVRRLPHFIHSHDLAWHQGQLVVAGNVPDAVSSGAQSERHGSALATSSDGGQHWQVQRLQGWRATALLPVDGHLFAIEALPGPGLERWLDQNGRARGFVAVHQWQADGPWQARRDIPRSALLPAVPGAEQRFAWIEQATPAGQAVAWIASLGAWRGDPPRREAFVAQGLRPGDIRVAHLPLETGELAMDLQATGAGWLLLSSRKLDATHWASRITEVQIRPQGIHQQPVLSFQAPLPAWSLAGDRRQLFVGLGHPPFHSEPSPGRCRAADRFSGTVLKLKRL